MTQITVITATRDDFQAAPAWVVKLLNEWAPPDLYPVWDLEIQVAHNEQDIELYFDLVTPGGSTMACGQLPTLLRHLSKANIATIARGSLLQVVEGGPVPRFLQEHGTDQLMEFQQLLEHPEEAQWLLGVSADTVERLKAGEPPSLPMLTELNPGIRDTWASFHQDAMTAVHLV